MKTHMLKTFLPMLLLIIAVFIIGSGCIGEPQDYSYHWYPDLDQDGFGDNSVDPTVQHDQPLNYIKENHSDCDDTDPGINPDSIDIPDNTIDENCNGLFAITFYKDSDNDGFGNSISGSVFEIELGADAPNGMVYNNADCDDSNDMINPLADEIVGNDIDDNCNGEIDIDDIRYLDEDNDGYGSSEQSPADGVFNSLDCDDTNPLIHPYAKEIKENGIDDDCDGMVDEIV
ncbi:putative metal-binding motif-containing protein [Winogradskyella sp. PC D3.3]